MDHFFIAKHKNEAWSEIAANDAQLRFREGKLVCLGEKGAWSIKFDLGSAKCNVAEISFQASRLLILLAFKRIKK